MSWARFKALVINNLFWIFLGTAIVISLLLIPPSNAQAATIFQGSDSVESDALFVNTFSSADSCISTEFVSGASGFVGDIPITFRQGPSYNRGWDGDINTTIYMKVMSSSSVSMSDFIATSSVDVALGDEQPHTYDFIFPAPFSVVSGETYRIALYRFDSGREYANVYYTTGAVAGSIVSGYTYSQASSNNCFESVSGSLSTFATTIGTSVPPGPPPQTISITAFLNDTGYGAFWGVDYNAATSTTYQAYTGPFYEIDITAGNTSSTYESTLVGRQDLTQTISGADASTTIPAYQGFSPGITYYAQGELIFHQNWGDSGLLVATSSIFTFSVPFPTTPGYFPASTTTVPTSTISTTNVCDPNAFFLIYGVCRLFVPQASDFVIFNIMKSYVQNKPPFGYIGLTVSALQNLNSGTPGFWFPDLTSYALVLDPIRTGINMLFWVLFVFWLLYKFRNVEL